MLTARLHLFQSQELKRPIEEWKDDLLGALTNLMVSFTDLGAINVNKVRDKLIGAFQALADRIAAAEGDFSSMSQSERDVFVDVVWIIDQLACCEEAKEKAEWEPLVNLALDVVLVDQLPPLMRRETLLCLKSVTQGCVDTSTALKNALVPNGNAKRSRRMDSSTKLGSLSEIFLKCGDFSAQKHIAEILYRLVRANLLDQDVTANVFTHVSSQFKDLFKIENSTQMFKSLKTLVRHYNAAQGSAATVKSFEAEEVTMKGLRMQDNWVNFGQEMMTLHVCLEDDGGVEPVDVLYSNIRTFAMPERRVAQVGIREKPIGLDADDPFDLEDDEWIEMKFKIDDVPSVLEQLYRVGRHSTAVDICVTNFLPSKKVSTGIVDTSFDLEPIATVNPTPPATKSQKKPEVKKAPRKSRGKVVVQSDSDNKSDSGECETIVPMKPAQASRKLPKRKAKQEGLKKMSEQLNDDVEDFELAEEAEPSPSPPPLRVAPPARKLKFTPKAVSPSIDSEEETEADDDNLNQDWTCDDIPALMKMIRAKGTSKKQREELQHVVVSLKSAVPPGKSLFKTPAATLVVPKTGPRPGILKSPDAKRLKTGYYDTAPDWKNRFAPSREVKKAVTTTATTDLNFDDDDDDSGGGALTPLSNFLDMSDDVSPLLSEQKAKKKSEKPRAVSGVGHLAAMGDDMAGFQQMMHSLAERNRRIARERIESLVNEFKLESEAAARKLTQQIEQDYDSFARAASRQADERAREAKAVASKVTALTADFKSALRACYEEFNANKRAAVADATRVADELASLDAKRSADVAKFAAKSDAKRARVVADIAAAARGAMKNDSVKSMLLELAREL